MHAASARLAQRRGGGVHRLAGRIDVVDEAEAWRSFPCRRERPAHVAAAVGEREPRLTGSRRSARDGGDDGQVPAATQLAGERRGGMLAAQEGAVGIRRHRSRAPRRPEAPRLGPRDRRPLARGRGARAPSSCARALGPRRRTRSPPWPTRTPAFVPRTRRSGEPATPSAPRSARRAAAGCGAGPRDTSRTARRPGCGRPHTASERAGRARHPDGRAQAVTPLRQLCEKTRSASSSCSRSPMSYHCPGTCHV